MEKKEEEDILTGPKFSPPLYQQRYNTIVNLIKENNAKRVLDAGCSEGKLLSSIKLHCPDVEEIIGIDVDKELLMMNRFRLKPLVAEYLFKRSKKLRMALFHGSITEPDIVFRDFDFLACVEVVEHLLPDNLSSFPAAIFGVFSPKVVAITTPNAEFNVLFENFSGFRHPDHKFEWTRAEFRSWCINCSQMYGYSVEFSCIGDGPPGTEDLGGCSQMAVFKRIADQITNVLPPSDACITSFESISDVTYPFQQETSLAEKLLLELRYLINFSFSKSEYETVGHEDDEYCVVRRVPLEDIMQHNNIKSMDVDIDMLREAAKQAYEVSEDGKDIIVCQEEDEDDDFEEDNCYDHITNEESPAVSENPATEEGPEEIWE